MSRDTYISREARELAILFGPALIIFYTQYIWKLFYFNGVFPGFYWFFVVLDTFYLHITIGSLILSILLLVAWLAIKKRHFQPLLLAGTFLFVFIAMALTLPMTFTHNTFHIQSIRAEGKVFHLSASPMFDINYDLSKCDALGIVCKTIYHSGDINSSRWAKLKYNDETRILSVVDPEKGNIFSYKVTKFLSLGLGDE